MPDFQNWSIFAVPERKISDAQVAKLVDALCSGRSARKGVLVRIQSWAPKKSRTLCGIFYLTADISCLSIYAYRISVTVPFLKSFFPL